MAPTLLGVVTESTEAEFALFEDPPTAEMPAADEELLADELRFKDEPEPPEELENMEAFDMLGFPVVEPLLLELESGDKVAGET